MRIGFFNQASNTRTGPIWQQPRILRYQAHQPPSPKAVICQCCKSLRQIRSYTRFVIRQKIIGSSTANGSPPTARSAHKPRGPDPVARPDAQICTHSSNDIAHHVGLRIFALGAQHGFIRCSHQSDLRSHAYFGPSQKSGCRYPRQSPLPLRIDQRFINDWQQLFGIAWSQAESACQNQQRENCFKELSCHVCIFILRSNSAIYCLYACIVMRP